MASKRFAAMPTVSAAAVAVSLSALLAGCGGSPTKASSSSATTVAPAGGQTATGPATFPGAFGSVAAISGSSMEVQNAATGQTTVSWTSSTSFIETVKETEAALTPGMCAAVTGIHANGKLTARSVTISAPSPAGTCPDRRGAGIGAAFTRPGAAQSGSAPSGSIPSGTRTAGPGNFSFTSGKVVSASGPTLVLYGTTFSGGLGRRTGSTSTTTVPASDITVTLASATTYTEQKAVTAANLAVGDCVAATGTTDDTGAVTARTVRITSTGGQDCSSAFVGGFGGGRGSGFSGGGATAGGSGANGQTSGGSSGSGIGG